MENSKKGGLYPRLEFSVLFLFLLATKARGHGPLFLEKRNAFDENQENLKSKRCISR